MRNLAVKNNCFWELLREYLTKEMKRRALPLLIFMTLKTNGDLKSRGEDDGSFQREHADKVDCTSPMPDFHTLKHVAEVSAKESRDVTTVDLPEFFLQTEAKKTGQTADNQVDGRGSFALSRMRQKKMEEASNKREWEMDSACVVQQNDVWNLE